MNKRKKWLPQEQNAFVDGVRNKAQTFADQRKKRDKQACRKWKWNGVE